VVVIYYNKPGVGQTKTRGFMGIFKGQGATEYLVLLAVVLIVALVSVALLGFFPGMAADARITQSQSYWRGQARPFAILDASINTTNATLSVQNMEANGPYNITAISINGTGTAVSTNFAAGETKTMYVPGTFTTCTTNTIYDYGVTITYNSPNINGLKQYSGKNLIGKCT